MILLDKFIYVVGTLLAIYAVVVVFVALRVLNSVVV
jgi:hypothetical protein